uniref:60S ribosomal export protein NMD3-like n=1 Tax=Styela clava TaxID=7725 RepID=UPI00193ACB47|nr:60S ribosomal export protein NMD3-like [Styela clava]
METMSEMPSTQTMDTILCCDCGIPIQPNPSNTCVDCLRSRVDITDGIPKSGNLLMCRNCERYHSPPNAWTKAALESRELLAICLKRLKSTLSKVRLVDAAFVWTEPHSKRIKVKIAIQKEVDGGTFLQQTFVVEFVIHNHMCNDCHRIEAKDFWNSVVQARQKTTHKKTFYYLEQIILKHKMHSTCTKLSENPNGLDFFYSSKQDARKFTDFLMSMLPCRYQSAQQLISHDVHTSTYNYKTTFSVEIPPVCKDDIVCLPKKLAQQLGNMDQLALCIRVTNCIHLIDFKTLQLCEVNGTAYWRNPFYSCSSSKNLIQYIVMEIEPIRNRQQKSGEGAKSHKHLLADCWVVKASELGINEDYVHTVTHLGHLLNPGDTVLGYDLRNSNQSNVELDKMKEQDVPDVILVKKVFGDKQRRRRRRNWKLRRLATNTASDDESFVGFMEDLEEDKEFRKNVDVYVDRSHVPTDTDDESMPKITLQEMLEDLTIEDDVDMAGNE